MSEKRQDIRLVFFDLGNVLVHLHLERFFTSFANLAGITAPQAMHIADNHDAAIDAFNRGLIDANTFYTTVTSGLNPVDFASFKKSYTDIFDLNTFMLEQVHRLKSKCSVSILSNTDPLHFDYIRRRFNFIDLFDTPITSYQAHAMKPEKEIYQYALQQLNVLPNQTLFIDDKIENINGARALGMYGIHYTKDNTALLQELAAFSL